MEWTIKNRLDLVYRSKKGSRDMKGTGKGCNFNEPFPTYLSSNFSVFPRSFPSAQFLPKSQYLTGSTHSDVKCRL